MMLRAKVRRWGDSLGLILPKELAAKAGLEEGDEVEITITKAVRLEGLFGKLPFKDLGALKEELRRGWGE